MDPLHGLRMNDPKDWLGSRRYALYLNLKEHQRAGQAFFNALCPEDQQKLTGTLADPFHSDSTASIYKAVAFLLEN